MKYSFAKKQTGAVLAFSLVMLLLLTLVGTSMIQQNKAQIAITGNASQQTQTFSAVEAALAAAQTAITNQRNVLPLPVAPLEPKCKSADQINQGDQFLNLGSGSASATVKAVYCISDFNKDTKVGDEYQCLYSSNGAGNRITTIGGATPDGDLASDKNVGACNYLNAAGSPPPVAPSDPKACQIEEYLLNVVLTDSNTGAKRTIESKFEVNCAGNLNP